MSSRLSFNMNGTEIGDIGKATFVLNRLQPTSVVIMDNIPYANQLAAQLPNTTVIYRQYHPHDHIFWDSTQGGYLSPAQYVDWVKGYGLDKNVWVYVLNEPPVNDDAQTIQRFVTWLREVAKLLRIAGIHGVLANFSVGGYALQSAGDSRWDDLLKLLDEYYGYHVLGVHEYASVLLPAGVGVWQNEALLDRSRVQQVLWPKSEQLKFVDNAGKLPPFWLLLRSAWLSIRAQKIKVKQPKFYVTEFGWDFLSNLAPILDQLKTLHGTNGHEYFQCYDSMKGVWSHYFPAMTSAKVALTQLEWADNIYPENYLGFNLFAWNYNYRWHQQGGCNFAPDDAFLNELFAYRDATKDVSLPTLEVNGVKYDNRTGVKASGSVNETPVVSPYPILSADATYWQDATLSSTGVTSTIRSFPSTSGLRSGTITKNNAVQVAFIVSYHDVNGDLWIAVRKKRDTSVNANNSDIIGWCRSDVVTGLYSNGTDIDWNNIQLPSLITPPTDPDDVDTNPVPSPDDNDDALVEPVAPVTDDASLKALYDQIEQSLAVAQAALQKLRKRTSPKV